MAISIPMLTGSNPIDIRTGKPKRGRPSKLDVISRDEAETTELRSRDLFPEQSDEDRVDRISERFDIMWRLTRGVINGIHRSVIVSGAPGVGKSHTIVDLLNQARDTDGVHGLRKIRFDSFSGAPISGINLYMSLYKFQKENCVTLIDDSDSIYEDEITLNLLKTALDSKNERHMRWPTEPNVLKSTGIPTEFQYKGQMIFITNKNMQGIVDVGKSRMVPHFKALMSRSVYMDLQLHSIKDLLAWVTYMVTTKKILQQTLHITESQEMEALDWVHENHMDMRELSIRTLLTIGKYMLTDETMWQKFARVTLLR